MITLASIGVAATRRNQSMLFAAAILAAKVLPTPLHAQTRSTKEVERTWPPSETWGTALLGTIAGPLICLTLTRSGGAPTEDWGVGVAKFGEESMLMIVDPRPANVVVVKTIQLFVDNALVGTFAAHPMPGSPERTIFEAPLNIEQWTRVLNLMRLGDSIKFATETSTYAANLRGAAQSLANLDACIAEARELAH